MKRLLISLFLVGATCLAWAYDIKVPMQGYSLYFNIVDSNQHHVAATAPRTAGNYRWNGEKAPAGVLELPSEIEYAGVKYTLTAIEERAFSGCTRITGVVLPTSLASIGAYAFSNCTGMRGVLTIGENIRSIGLSAFYGCKGIAELQYNAVACSSMGSSSNTVFSGCHGIKKVTFGPSVQQIPAYAFAGLNMLKTEVVLPESLVTIDDYAFAYCNVLPRVTIPASVKTMGERVFYRCTNLKQVTIDALVPPTLGNESFSGISAVATLIVPCIGEERYRQADEWKRIPHIKKMEPCTINILAGSNDPQMGVVMGGGNHVLGDTITLTAVCHAGYGFKGWSDGMTDNPRRVVITDTFSCTAMFQATEVKREIEYVHDTIYKDGIETIYEYYEINDIAEPIDEQEEVVYNSQKRRIEVPIDRKEIVSIALYNDAGVCVSTGKPRFGHINMRRYPTGYYIVRITTADEEQAVRFLHVKNR